MHASEQHAIFFGEQASSLFCKSSIFAGRAVLSFSRLFKLRNREKFEQKIIDIVMLQKHLVCLLGILGFHAADKIIRMIQDCFGGPQ